MSRIELNNQHEPMDGASARADATHADPKRGHETGASLSRADTRLADLHAAADLRCKQLDPMHANPFQSVVNAASHGLDAPLAFISLTDAARKWLNARVGLSASKTVLETDFCAHTLQQDEVFVVADATQDDRFKASPVVAGPAAIRFFAGAPVRMPDGLSVGALCVMDVRARNLPEMHKVLLADLAQMLQHAFSSRRDRADLSVYQAIAEAISSIQTGDAADSDNIKRLFNHLLASILELTNSEYGFIGERFHDDHGAPYLKTHAITNIAWDAETQKFYEENEAGGFEFRNLKSLFGHTLATGETVISNRPKGDARACGTPKGHPPLKAYLGAPLMSSGQFVGMVGVANRPNGYSQEIIDKAQPLLAAIGNIVKANRAEHERKDAEAQLQQKKRYLQLAEHVAKIGHWRYDIAQDKLYWSDGVYRMHGVTPETFTPDVTSGIGFYHPDDRAGVEEDVNQAIHDGRPFMFERRIVTAQNEIRWVLSKGQCEKDSKGETSAIFGTILDIHERKRAEELKSEFVSTVSHELRTPITSILGAIDLVKSEKFGELNESARQLLSVAADSGQRLVRLINDILDIQKIESGRLYLKKQPVAISDLIKAAAEHNARFIELYGASLSINDETDGALIHVDTDRFQQVLTNLISNAAKFTKDGGKIHIDAFVTGHHVEIAVIDNGPGIAPDDQSAIFERFVQVDGSDHRHTQGSGLGLAICKEIIDAHGGDLRVESDLGHGAAFIARLPLFEMQPAGRSDADASIEILHVIDEVTHKAGVDLGLDAGAHIKTVATPSRAFAFVQRAHFDVVIVNATHVKDDPSLLEKFVQFAPDIRFIICDADDVDCDLTHSAIIGCASRQQIEGGLVSSLIDKSFARFPAQQDRDHA